MGQGSSKRHRKIYPLVGLLLALVAIAPASAAATSLLSGYGGPGQGSQAILGSGFVNGPSSGGGGGPAASGSAATGTSGSSASGSQAAGGPAAHRPAGSSHARRTPGAGTASSAPALGSGVPEPTTATLRPAADSGVLGLSGTDLLLVILALAALLFTGLLTRGLARSHGTRGHAGN